MDKKFTESFLLNGTMITAKKEGVSHLSHRNHSLIICKISDGFPSGCVLQFSLLSYSSCLPNLSPLVTLYTK